MHSNSAYRKAQKDADTAFGCFIIVWLIGALLFVGFWATVLWCLVNYVTNH